MPASHRPSPPRAVPRPSTNVVDLPARQQQESRVEPTILPKRTTIPPPPTQEARARGAALDPSAPSSKMQPSGGSYDDTQIHSPQSTTSPSDAPPSSRRRRDSAPPSTGFAATIDGASIADLVQLECLRGLTRAVRVIGDDSDGVLYFDQGQLVHAEVGETEGEAAALEILSWGGGRVEPSDSYWINAPTIATHWQGLLMVAAQREDERAARPESENKVPVHTPEKVRAHASQSQKKERPVTNVLRAVRLDTEGRVVQSEGDVAEFSDAAAYAVRLAQLIGEGLGLEEFQGFECTAQEKTMVTYVEEDGSVVAIEATPHADVSAHKKKAGL